MLAVAEAIITAEHGKQAAVLAWVEGELLQLDGELASVQARECCADSCQ